ncbi:MAG: sigma-70 family RNA polymerase sigma factor [Bacteroidetes bacterium]|jgi:RNA polymerase sigma-70 factor (ECF subfamily)|nr:sigma-70 family RNA polymerase sigma factor [Bacteroidota bacterium]
MALSKTQQNKLIKGCLSNDRASQEALYKLFHSDMLRVCYTYLNNRELAREALNSGFLKVFQSIGNFDDRKGNLGGWIRKLMIHTSIDLCRKELVFKQIVPLNDEAEEIFITPNILERLHFEDILASIHTLPYSMQTVFNLYILDGLTHKEISEQLGISEVTSRWHLSEAKKKLKALLEDSPEERREKRI